MIPPAATLPELLQQLKRTFSPFERLRILGRAWVLLRHMSPQERVNVAAQLGLDHADDLVEAIAARSGTQASPGLLSMIDQAQKKGTAHLPQLISDLKDPGKRAERLRQGVEAAEAALVGVKPPPLPPPVPETHQPPAIPFEAVELITPPTEPPPAEPPPPPPPPAPPVLTASPPPAPPPAPPVAQKPEAMIPEPPPPPPRPEPPPEPPAPSAGPAPVVEIAPPLHLMERFRELHHTVDGEGKLSISSLRSLVEGFPDGWARRRALLELLRAGNPPLLRDALALLDTLGSERDRLWCLGALADRDLAAADREILLAAAPSSTARRRLERRLGP